MKYQMITVYMDGYNKVENSNDLPSLLTAAAIYYEAPDFSHIYLFDVQNDKLVAQIEKA